MNNIYIAIASYRDAELTNTIYSALSNAHNKDRLFFYVFSQDEDDSHPNLDSLFNLFNIKSYFYDKEHYQLSTGVGYARSRATSLLTDEYKYFLQIDSHTQFAKDWDEKLIKDYEKLLDIWGTCIFSTYPPGYTYEQFGDIRFQTNGIPPVVDIFKLENSLVRFEAKYADYMGGDLGQSTGYFCAGFGFGYSSLFKLVPYDKLIYFQGEEQTMSIRFFANNIKIICPPSVYLFHDYDGSRRFRNWEKNDGWKEHDQNSINRIESFFKNDIEYEYGPHSLEKIGEWASCYVKPRQT
jgi:hypothetical protein